jgi:hypothetical protein
MYGYKAPSGNYKGWTASSQMMHFIMLTVLPCLALGKAENNS